MKFQSKAKEKINQKLKIQYPIFTAIIDIRYKDKDWQELEYDEITGKSIIMTADQYEHNLELDLQKLMIPIQKQEASDKEARILKALSDEPCGVYGD